MKRTASRTVALLGLALMLVCTALAPAALASSAAGTTKDTDSGDSGTARTVHVSGTQTPTDPPSAEANMHGDLVGTWFTYPGEVLYSSDTLYAESGKETFTGCIDKRHNGCDKRDVQGELYFVYLYWVSFNDKGLIKGQCVHPITGGKDGFAGARGVINMVDTPVGEADEVRTTYRGEIELNEVSEPTPVPPGPAAAVAATVTTAGAAHGATRSC